MCRLRITTSTELCYHILSLVSSSCCQEESITSHVFTRNGIMAFPNTSFFIEGTSHHLYHIYRKDIDLFILFILGNFSLMSKYLLNVHCVQMYEPKSLSSSSLKSIGKSHVHNYLTFKVNVLCVRIDTSRLDGSEGRHN